MVVMPEDAQGALEFLLTKCKGELMPHGGVMIPMLSDGNILLAAMQALPNSPRPVRIIVRGSRYGLRVFDRYDAPSDEYVILVRNAFVIGHQAVYGLNGGCAWRAHDIIASITGLPAEILHPVILKATTEVILTHEEATGTWKFFYRLRIYGPPYAR